MYCMRECQPHAMEDVKNVNLFGIVLKLLSWRGVWVVQTHAWEWELLTYLIT